MFWTFPLSLRQPPHLCFTYPGDDITTDFSEIKPFIFPQTHPFLCPLTVLLSQLRDDVSDTSLCLRFFPSFVAIPVSSGFLTPIATLPLVVLKEPHPFADHLDVGIPKGSFPSTSLRALLANLRASVTVWVERASRASASKT